MLDAIPQPHHPFNDVALCGLVGLYCKDLQRVPGKEDGGIRAAQASASELLLNLNVILDRQFAEIAATVFALHNNRLAALGGQVIGVALNEWVIRVNEMLFRRMTR